MRNSVVLAGLVLVLVDCATGQSPNWTQKFPATSPPGRFDHSLAYDAARREVVLFGGFGIPLPGGGFVCCLDDTWIWDGTNWSMKNPGISPSPRQLPAMAFDSFRGQTVLFGGAGGPPGSFLNDTWIWDGTNWTNAAPPSTPSSRAGATMAFDQNRGEVVLFGGGTSLGEQLDDTWIWDGTSWTQWFPSTRPPVRMRAAMTYDSIRNEIVLFGGIYKLPSGLAWQSLNDTWIWDGTNWTQRFPAQSPPIRDSHGMAFQSVLGRTVVFGGSVTRSDNTGGWNTDTWIWDGVNWTQVPGATPGIMDNAAMVYDSQRQEILLFTGNLLRNETWVWGGGAAGCTVSSIEVNESFSNEVLSASVAGSPCETATMTVFNRKPYWVNFDISVAGNVVVVPLGGATNPIANFGLLPPLSSVAYVVSFSQPGEAITIFGTPTCLSSGVLSCGAGRMNLLQVLLNFIPLGGSPVLVVSNYETILEAFQEMPHLENATTALFMSSPKWGMFGRELRMFVRSPSEVTRFRTLLFHLGLDVGVEVIKTVLSIPGAILRSAWFAFGHVKDSVFGHPAGSVQVIAR